MICAERSSPTAGRQSQILIVSEIVGHTYRSTTTDRYYTQFTEEQVREGMNRIEESLLKKCWVDAEKIYI